MDWNCNDHQPAFSPHLASNLSSLPPTHTHTHTQVEKHKTCVVNKYMQWLLDSECVSPHPCIEHPLCTVENNISFLLPFHPSHRQRLAEQSALANTLLSPSLFTRWSQSHAHVYLGRERGCLAARHCRHPARSVSHHIIFESPTKRVRGTLSTPNTAYHTALLPSQANSHARTRIATTQLQPCDFRETKLACLPHPLAGWQVRPDMQAVHRAVQWR